MTARLFFAASLALSLAGCATYSNDYRDSYADGSYYSPADGDNGDYYYAPERSDSYYSDGYYGGSYYDYRYYLGPIGYGSYDGYCSVRYSTCAPYWYGGYSPSYSRYGFSLIFGSYGGFGGYGRYGHGYNRQPYYGYGYRSQPIYRGSTGPNRPTPNPTTTPGWSSNPGQPGAGRSGPGRNWRDPSNPENRNSSDEDAPARGQPRPLYREPALGGSAIGRPMPERTYRSYREPPATSMQQPMPEPMYRNYREPSPAPMERPMPAPRPAYREDRPEPRVYRQPERPMQEMRRPEPRPMPTPPPRAEQPSPPSSTGQGEAPSRSGRRRLDRDGDGG